MRQIPFHGETGSILAKTQDSFEVATDIGIRCVVSTERDEFGELYVDVPANWLHTDEDRHAVVLQAQTAVEEWMRS